MQKSVIGMNHKGFTLVEILVVIVIIGISAGVALLAFGDFGQSRRLQFAAEQFLHTLEAAQQQAILETTAIGLQLTPTSYRLIKLQGTSSNKGIFKTRYFPKNTRITLTKSSPTLVINASGDMTPFTMDFGNTQEPRVVRITGEHNGHLTLLTSHKE